jgi:hypothetical protein
MMKTAKDAPDFWSRIRDDQRMENVRRKLSMDELRTLFQHARDSIASPPFPDGEAVKLTTDIVPYSSIVGGGLILKKMDGRAGFLVNFIGTSEGITKEETGALSAQFALLDLARLTRFKDLCFGAGKSADALACELLDAETQHPEYLAEIARRESQSQEKAA